MFFVRGGGIWWLNPDSLEERSIVEFPGAQLGECTLGAGGEWLTAAAKPLLNYLSKGEVRAMIQRAEELVQAGVFPSPDPFRRAFPWPQI